MPPPSISYVGIYASFKYIARQSVMRRAERNTLTPPTSWPGHFTMCLTKTGTSADTGVGGIYGVGPMTFVAGH